jgi:hypothetical protein
LDGALRKVDSAAGKIHFFEKVCMRDVSASVAGSILDVGGGKPKNKEQRTN